MDNLSRPRFPYLQAAHPAGWTGTSLILLFLLAIAANAEEKPLGWLSKKYEVNRGGSKTVSSGKARKKNKETGEWETVDDPGGISYGSYQLASKRGLEGSSVKVFVETYYPNDFRQPSKEKPDEFEPIPPGTPEFEAAWKKVVRREGDRFHNNEHEFIYDTHYLPVVRDVKKLTGLEVEERGDTLKNVLWSTAVQHGPASTPKGHAAQLVEAALSRWKRAELAAKQDSKESRAKDEEIIDAIYAERSRQKESGDFVYFNNDQSVRFRAERADARSARAREKLAEENPPDLNKTRLGQIAGRIGIIAAPVREKSPELKVEKGQPTFDLSGYDEDFKTTRKPHVPGDYSGVRIGRGYDLARVTPDTAAADLKAAGLQEPQVGIFSRAAGLRGEQAREFLNSFNYSRLSTEAKEIGLTGKDATEYIHENQPQTITLEQQRRLFETAYARAEEQARDYLPRFDSYPDPARQAITDMMYDRGPHELEAAYLGFLSAVNDEKWDLAAILSKRNGAGVARNETTRKLLEAAAKKPASHQQAP